MSVKKHTRKNFYKNSPGKKTFIFKTRFLLVVKFVTGFLILAMMSFVFIMGYMYMIHCEYFNARSIGIEGAERLSQQEIVDCSGIKPGDNILALNISTARLKLLANPWIAEAEVYRKLPSTIGIKVKEHTPLAVINVGRAFIINTSGEIFKEWAPSDPDNLPVITGLSYSDLNESGKPRTITFEAVLDALETGLRTEMITPAMRIKRIDVDRETGLTLYAFDRIKSIRLGYNDYDSKYSQLKHIISYLDTKQNMSSVDLVDLKNSNRIVIKPGRNESHAIQKEV